MNKNIYNETLLFFNAIFKLLSAFLVYFSAIVLSIILVILLL